ncbi:MAG: 1-deoxy-D-xylulose-5-phosphate reductoisomerase [Bacterioplanes sp.]|nr:1-deoxy-D-xylulose-5-phosphate reductoisomerase [Bacterioplanes sp.]
MRQAVTVLGSTGSIGINTLDVIARHPDRYFVFALGAGKNVTTMAQQIVLFQPRYAVLAAEADALQLQAQLPSGTPTTVLFGDAAMAMIARHDDVSIVMAAIVGAAGLLPTLAAAQAGKRVLLANKESLVMAGPLFMQAVADGGAQLLPIDSEHNAIFQAMPVGFQGDYDAAGIKQILLTASGGPFRGWSSAQLHHVTPAQAVAHPNWSMGQKISVDSATLMNKGLELIEACFLFHCQPEQIQVVVHPQSVIHSMVQYCDGSVIAQLGQPDMRTPIAYGLAWPERIEAGVEALDLFQIARLDFCQADEETFPCLTLAREAFAAGGTMPAVLNAANEVAVEAFLAEQIHFDRIPTLIQYTMQQHTVEPMIGLQQVLNVDSWARECAKRALIEGTL